MRHPSILKTAVATGAGLLLALSTAAPAVADPPPAPGTGPFHASVVAAEDDCSYFVTGGTVRWPVEIPEPTTVTVGGWRSIGKATATGPCERGTVSARQIEFTAYGAGVPLAEHIVPFRDNGIDTDTLYEFALSGSSEIEYVTAAVCLERLPDGSTWPERCGTLETITPTEDTGPSPSPYCRYSNSYEHWYGGGFLSEVAIIPVTADSTDWRIEIDLPEDTSITSLWNGEWTQTGSAVTVTNATWNGLIQTGDTELVGLIGTGQPPQDPDITVYVDGEQCWDVGDAI